MHDNRLTISIFFGFLPGILWLVYFYRKDALEPEPKNKIIKAYILGIVTAVPVGLAGMLPHHFVQANLPGGEIWSAVVVAPIIEELFKFSAVYFFFFRDTEFDEPMDGIIYAVSIALGFASIENAGYVMGSFKDGTTGITIVLRAFLSVPGHALFASFYGFALGAVKFKTDKKTSVRTALFAAMGAHALFNLSAYAGGMGLGYITLIIMASLWKRLAKNIRISLGNSPHLKG